MQFRIPRPTAELTGLEVTQHHFSSKKLSKQLKKAVHTEKRFTDKNPKDPKPIIKNECELIKQQKWDLVSAFKKSSIFGENSR